MECPINIAYVIDDKYTEHLCTSISSVLSNTSKEVYFHVVSKDITDFNRKILEEFIASFPKAAIYFYYFEPPKSLSFNPNYPSDVYTRLFLDDLLPHLTKVIYLDADVVLEGDISELWSIDLGEKAICAVADLLNYKENIIKKLKSALRMGYSDIYFNSGVMLINLHEYSKLQIHDNFYESALSLHEVCVNQNVVWLPDQHILNFYAHKNKAVKIVDFRYNLRDNYDWFSCLKALTVEELHGLSEAMRRPLVIHFAALIKPWHFSGRVMPCYFRKRYFDYKRDTPFYDEEENRKNEVYDVRLKNLFFNAVLLNVESYIQFFWREVFGYFAKKTKELIGNKLLVFWGCGVQTPPIYLIFRINGLTPYDVVDSVKYGQEFMGMTIQGRDLINNNVGNLFIVLCMSLQNTAEQCYLGLRQIGYSEDSILKCNFENWLEETRNGK